MTVRTELDRRWIIALAVVVALLLTAGASGAGDFQVRLVSQSNSTITLGWDQQASVDGFRFYRDGVLVSRTFDPLKTSVKFSKGTSYRVESIVMAPAGSGVYPPPPPVVSAAQVWVSTTGSDSSCVRGNESLPCLTMNKAYAISQCGDIVEMAAGTYANQTMLETSSGSACSSPIVFQPAIAATVTVPWIQLGSDNVGATNAPDNLTLTGFSLTRGINMWGDAVNVTLDRINGGSFLVGGGARNVTVRDSDWGPCEQSSDNTVGCWHYYTGDGRSGQPRVLAGSSNVLLEGNTFHDMTSPGGGHWECMWINGGSNVTIRRNWFFNCVTNAIALGDAGSDGNLAGTWLIENNWFGHAATSALKFGGLPYSGMIVIRGNSFSPSDSIVDEEVGNAQGRVIVVGNIIGTPSYLGSGMPCVAGAVYAFNVFVNAGGGKCAGTGNVNLPAIGGTYVNADAYGAANYRLGVAATAADNLVPLSAPSSDLGDDFDRETRPAGANRDAGADER